MLPPFLGGTYKRYKQDTSTFVQWLLETATQKFGYRMDDSKSGDTPEQDEPAKAAPRLKGKARKLAKATGKAAEGAGPSTNSTNRGPHLVQATELLPLARAIVASENIQIPSNIIQAGLRAISARKRCTEHFMKATPANHSKQSLGNKKHLHFISLMENVLMTLQPRFSTSAGSVSKDAMFSVASIETFINRFEVLDLEEPSEHFADVVDEPLNTSTDDLTYEIAIGKSKNELDEERLFAIYSLFDDLFNIRTFLMRTWVAYAMEEIDLVTASITTNMAFQLAIRTQDETLAAFPECRIYDKILAALVDAVANATGQTDEIEIDDNLAHWICAPAHSILDTFVDDVLMPANGTVPRMKRGHFGVYNPLRPRAKMHDAEKQREDLIILLELLPEFCLLSKSETLPNLLAVDELTKGLCKMFETKEIPVWLTFAVSVLLDIHHVWRQRIERAFHDMQRIGNLAQQSLKKYFEVSRGLPVFDNWPNKNEYIVKVLENGIQESVLKDVLWKIKNTEYSVKSFGPLGEEDRWYLYKRQPVLCGILASEIILRMHQLGSVLVNAWGTVLYPAQLYNMLRLGQGGNQPVKPWPLMEQVISTHGENQIFIGAPPATLEDSFKQACLMLGVSVTSFSKKQRRPGLKLSPNGPRGLKESSTIAAILMERDGEDLSSSITMHRVEQLLAQHAESQTATNASHSLRRKWKTTQKLSSLEFLEALRTSLSLEMPKLKLDYFELHRQSIGFLRNLRIACDAEFRKFMDSPQYIENESQLSHLAIYCIQIASGSEKAAKAMGFKEGEVYSKILLKAAEEMEKVMV